MPGPYHEKYFNIRFNPFFCYNTPMTAVPKHWPSSRRQGKRRASQTGPKIAKTVNCKHCGQPKMAGFQCPNCKQ